jgi:hypothetical protein
MGGRVEDVLRGAREAELLVQLNPNARPEEVRVQYTLPSLASMVLKGRMLMPGTRYFAALTLCQKECDRANGSSPSYPTTQYSSPPA